MFKEFSIIIPTYNSVKKLKLCLEALKDTLISVNAEVIIVDDGSKDATRKLVEEKFPEYFYIYQDNKGPAAARNTGAKQAIGDNLIFLDSDTIPQQGFIANLSRNITRTSGACFGTYDIANCTSNLSQCIQSEIACRHSKLKSSTLAFGSYCVLIPRNIFNILGGFDETYLFASCEDTDFSYRLNKANYHIHFAPDAIVRHFHTEDVLKYLREQYRHGFWRAKLYLKHYDMVRGDEYTFWKDIVEPPLCYLIFFFSIAIYFLKNILVKNIFKKLLFVNIATLLLTQIIHSLECRIPFALHFYFVVVTVLRAFSRSIGFIHGMFLFGFHYEN